MRLPTRHFVVYSLNRVHLLRPHGLQPSRLLCPWEFPGKKTREVCHFFLQGIFLTQGSNPCLQHWQVDFLPLCHQGSPCEAYILLSSILHFPLSEWNTISEFFFFVVFVFLSFSCLKLFNGTTRLTLKSNSLKVTLLKIILPLKKKLIQKTRSA